MYKKITYFLLLIFTLSACANSWDSVKRGITGGKKKSVDEFLVEKKDPLTLPPDFENLPKPTSSLTEEEQLEISSFEKTFNISESSEDQTSSSNSTEESILNKIRKK
tara:strand:+ start:565 stop:885 length:321 start_codon:yes stop_codon:yes gene_type:complete